MPHRTALRELRINSLDEPGEVTRCIRQRKDPLPIVLQTQRPLSARFRRCVFRGIITETGVEAAVKDITMDEKEDLRPYLDDLKRLASMEPCPQVARVYAFATLPSPSSRTIRVALELMDLGSMSDLLQRNKCKGIESPHLAHIAREMLKGLQYLHESGVQHGRIKPANVIYSATGEVKLTDYADIFSAEFRGSWNFEITDAIYMAPERANGMDWSVDADVWSAGMVVFELAAGVFPWRFDCLPELFALLLERPEPRLDGANHPTALCDFTAWCLVRDRPGQPWSNAQPRSKAQPMPGSGDTRGEQQRRAPQAAESQDLPPAPPAVVVVRTMTGEDVFGPAELPASTTAEELAQRVLAESGQKGLGRCGQVKLLDGMRELTEAERLPGRSPGTVLALTCVACGRARASVEELLQHDFLGTGVASKTAFADWLAMIC